MKSVVISDLHSQPSCLVSFEKILIIEKPSLVLCCGDITVHDDIKYFRSLSNLVKDNNARLLTIWGNSDEQNVQDVIEGSGSSLHLGKTVIDGIGFIGLGESDQPIAPNPADLAGSVFITHKPPVKSLLRQRLQGAPKYHLSGHIHSRAALTRYPSVTHIEVPTLQDERYVVFYPDQGKATFKKI